MTGRILVLLGLSFLCAIAACSSVAETQIGIDAPPGSEKVFGPLGDMLEHRCGTLDCHGQTGRNLRIWGCDGMRLDPKMTPGCGIGPQTGRTTPEEHYATYRSLVGLEPTVMTTVYEGCKSSTEAYPPPEACDPDLLTFVRKARGLEAHKGGQLISPDGVDGGPDPQDVCIVTWLEGQTDGLSCANALSIPNFPIPDAATE